MRACVVIPAYNAASTIGPLIRHIHTLSLSAIVVNDGSTDKTAEVAVQAGAVVISHVQNQGKGTALRSGFAYALQAGFEAIVTLDGDGQHDPAEIPRLLEAASASDAAIIVGCRTIDSTAMPWARRCTNRVMSRVISWAVRQNIPDSQCGFRVIRRHVLERMHLSTERFEIETEMLLAAARLGWPITSVPIKTIYENHSSHIKPVSDSLRFVRLMLRYLLSSS